MVTVQEPRKGGARVVGALDLVLGVALGLISYYALGFASALWVGTSSPEYLWSLLITAVVGGAFGFLLVPRAATTLLAAVVMLILVVIGFVMGTDTNLWIPPLPGDIGQIFLHGARSPFVLGALVFAGVASTRQLIAKRRQ